MHSRFVRTTLPVGVFIFSFLLSTQLGKHFFFPFSYLSGIRIDYLAPTLFLTDILTVFLLAIFLFQHIKDIKKIHLPQKKIVLLIFAILLLLGANYLFALSKPLWCYRFARVVQVVFLFYFFRKNGNREWVFSSIVLGLFFGAFIELILSISQLSLRHSLQGFWYFFGERQFSIFTPGIAKARMLGVEFLRPYGTFSHPNSMGGFYLLTYTFILTQKKITNTFFKGALLSFSSLLVLVSFSRTAVVVYVLINLIYFFGKNIDCRPCTVSKVFLSLFLLFLVFNVKGDQFSFQKRLTFLDNSIEIIKTHPMTGVGMGSYLIAQNKFPQQYSIFFEQPVHNIFFLAAAELGVPFSLLLFSLIYESLRGFLRKLPFFLPLLCVLITGSIDHYWITLQQNALLLTVIFGILYAQYEKKTL